MELIQRSAELMKCKSLILLFWCTVFYFSIRTDVYFVIKTSKTCIFPKKPNRTVDYSAAAVARTSGQAKRWGVLTPSDRRRLASWLKLLGLMEDPQDLVNPLVWRCSLDLNCFIWLRICLFDYPLLWDIPQNTLHYLYILHILSCQLHITCVRFLTCGKYNSKFVTKNIKDNIVVFYFYNFLKSGFKGVLKEPLLRKWWNTQPIKSKNLFSFG